MYVYINLLVIKLQQRIRYTNTELRPLVLSLPKLKESVFFITNQLMILCFRYRYFPKLNREVNVKYCVVTSNITDILEQIDG